MKKIYISPEIEFVSCVPSCAILEASLPLAGGGPSSEDEFEGEAVGAARGDWSNIWENM